MRNKNQADPFDTTAISKYLEKSKDVQNPSFVDGDERLPII
jgi:hypothetical protein